MDMPSVDIPASLARRDDIAATMALWDWQSFVHHEHPNLDSLDELECETEQLLLWEQILTERFPEYSFVLQQSPLYSCTWYQPFEGAPTNDDEKWGLWAWRSRVMFKSLEDFEAGLVLPEVRDALEHSSFVQTREPDLAKDAYSKLSRPKVHPKCRGVMTAKVIETGDEIVFATKTIRRVIGTTCEREVNWQQ